VKVSETWEPGCILQHIELASVACDTDNVLMPVLHIQKQYKNVVNESVPEEASPAATRALVQPARL